MFKGHPKGLIVAFFANMGERFGFYTMMAILVLFLQAKFGLGEDSAGYIYSTFYFLIYALALVGGFLADRVLGLKRTITTGIIVMVAGYALLAVPAFGITVTCLGLFVIAFGNGLFKGNLQALVGNLYEAPKYAHLRDRAFSLFYMGINVGAIFAPAIAVGIRNWYIKTQGFNYDAQLPKLAHEVINSNGANVTPEFLEKASAAAIDGVGVTAETAVQFANSYITAFSTGFNWAFGIAAISMIISFVVFTLFKKYLQPGMEVVKQVVKTKDGQDVVVEDMPASAVRERIIALLLVFLVVIFFWMSFHQNGLTLTFFAVDYTALGGIDRFTYLLFDIWGLLPAAIAVGGVIYACSKNVSTMMRAASFSVAVLAGWFAYSRFMGYSEDNNISAEIFQQFNPMFVVILTPVAIAFFSFLAKRNIEPSAPRKIGIGMIIAAIAFVVIGVGSMGMLLPSALNGAANSNLASPYLLIVTYLILTFAELFLSPMGISFVSKVAPPKYKGMMQGGWLCATALGNQLLFVGSTMWGIFTEVWQVWAIFVVCCLISATVIFFLMKKLERVTKSC